MSTCVERKHPEKRCATKAVEAVVVVAIDSQIGNAQFKPWKIISSRSNISHQPGCCPRVRIVPLVPIDEALPSCNPRYSRPAPTEDDVVLPVEKVGRVARVQIHGLESRMWRDSCRRPLPQAAHVSLTAEVAVSSHGSGMPVGKADICASQVDE